MKNRINLILIIACTFIAFACKDSDDPVNFTPSPGNDLIFSEGITFTNVDKSKSVSFTTNKSWEISLAETRNGTSWCRVEPMKGGPGEASITIEVDENEGYDDRSVALTINAGGTLKTIPISQKQKDALTVTANRFDVKPEGETISIEVKSNVTYEVIIPEIAKSWVNQASNNSRGLTTETISLKVEPSEEYDKRECEVIITDGTLSEKVTIYQYGSAIILLNEKDIAVSDAGETIQVELNYNFDYDIKMPDVDWIKENPTRAVSSHTLYYIIDPNAEYDSRKAEIIFFDKNDQANADTLTITQAAKGAIILSKKEFEINQRDTVFNVLVNTNVELNVTIPDTCNWITRIVSRALETRKLEFSVAANANPGMRSGVILVQNEASNLSETIRIIQRGTSVEVSLEESEIHVGVNGGEFRIKINSHVPVSLEPWNGNPPSDIGNEGNHNLFIYKNIGDIDLDKSIENNYLIIKVKPTSLAKLYTTYIRVYGKYEEKRAFLKITQTPDISKPLEIEFTKEGEGYISYLLGITRDALSYMQTMEAYYTQCWQPENNAYPWNEYYMHTVNPHSEILFETFEACYTSLQRLKYVEEKLDENDGKTRTALHAIKSVIYYEMMVLWGGVPYVTPDMQYNAPRMPKDELVQILTEGLHQSVAMFEQTKTNPTTDIYAALFPSRNVPLMLLARLAVSEGKWQDAINYLEQIVASNQYTLEASRAAALTKNSNEMIYTFLTEDDIYTQLVEQNETLPCLTYTEVYLSLAEACSKVGNYAKAMECLITVSRAKGINDDITIDNHRTVITELWKSELKGAGTYLEHLKRNNLAESVLEIESYRTLLPIPFRKILMNPSLTQNPGY